jgi:hypothetical protein
LMSLSSPPWNSRLYVHPCYFSRKRDEFLEAGKSATKHP